MPLESLLLLILPNPSFRKLLSKVLHAYTFKSRWLPHNAPYRYTCLKTLTTWNNSPLALAEGLTPRAKAQEKVMLLSPITISFCFSEFSLFGKTNLLCFKYFPPLIIQFNIPGYSCFKSSARCLFCISSGMTFSNITYKKRLKYP